MGSEIKKTLDFDPDANYDDAIQAMQRDIEKEIADTQALIGNKEELASLQRTYTGDEVYQKKLEDLKKKYKHFRTTRGDGNCFYRSFGFAYFEKLLGDTDGAEKLKGVATKTKDFLLTCGYQQMTIEDFYDNFVEYVGLVGSSYSSNDLLELFNNSGLSDYLVVFLRLIVSAHLQQEEDFYNNFMEGGRTVKEFCSQDVEPMYRENDHIHIIALTSATGISVRIEYMDRGEAQGGGTNHHDFPEGCPHPPAITLLYRPGHYDILYDV